MADDITIRLHQCTTKKTRLTNFQKSNYHLKNLEELISHTKIHFQDIGNVNLYIRQAKFDTQIPEFDTQIPKFDTQNFKIRHPNSRIRHLNSTGVEISSVVEYIDLRSHYHYWY